MIRQSKRLSLGSVINAAAGTLQQAAAFQVKVSNTRTTDATGSNQEDDTAHDQYAGIVFSGNPHETVPRRLLLDDRLSPLERNAWQVFRLLINSDGLTAFPTYEELRPYLGSTPGKPASRETIAKTLTHLRLTRWLSLGRRVRDAVSGRMQGNVYILHDEPIGCAEAMEIDRDFMLLIGQSLEHANKAIRLMAERAFNDVTADLHVVDQSLPTRLDVMAERLGAGELHDEFTPAAPVLTEFGIRTPATKHPETPSSDSELSEIERDSRVQPPSSESELMQQLATLTSVRNPNSYSTYTNTNTSVSKSFVLHESQTSADITESLKRLTSDQRQKAMAAISLVDPTVRQALLNQWHHRILSGGVKNPLAYLLSCVQKANKGEFNALWQAPSEPSRTPVTPVQQPKPQPESVSHSPVQQTASPPAPRDEIAVARGRDQMRAIRQELGF